MNATRKDIEISLVSIDLDLDPNPDKIYRFIDRKKLKSKVYILDERDPNTWIDKIDKSWSGAIPATLVVNLENGKRRFVEKELKEGDLEEIIDSVK
ncbi:MAG: TlpA family protein disulfide reductase, partial [Cyclobacteriaceae bacterium]